MLLGALNQPLSKVELPVPKPGYGQVLVRVHACAVCRTDLHVVDGELPNPKLPLIPGHEIVGTVTECGPEGPPLRLEAVWEFHGWAGRVALAFSAAQSVRIFATRPGLPVTRLMVVIPNTRWLMNGFASRFPRATPMLKPLPLCAQDWIGYRSLKRTGAAKRLGIYGFGAAAHIAAQVARFEGREVFAFTRRGDFAGQQFARELGASWAGDSDSTPPVKLDAAIIFAPAGALVPQALRAVEKGGTVVCGGIHMSAIPTFPYGILWHGRTVCSVANLTRRDAEEFLKLAPRVPVRTSVQLFPLAKANEALSCLRSGQLQGAAVLTIKSG